jgi:NTE family protein
MSPADPPKIRSDEKIALVLGAGGARGLAQIGVIEAIEGRNLKIVAIAGSSSGALVGGLHASGRLPAYREWLLSLDRGAMLRLLDPGFGRSALFEGTRLIAALREIAGSPKIEELPIDFTAVAVDVLRQREVWLREGDMWDAIRASFAIPGLFTPHIIHGRPLVDGGLLAPLPIAATRLSDAHRLVAVDMHGWPQRPPGEPAEENAPSGPSASRSWLTAWMHTRASDASADAARTRLGFTDLMARSLDTMQAQIARVQLALDPPELVIRIPRDACQFYEFWRAKELIDIGRREADKALDEAGY